MYKWLYILLFTCVVKQPWLIIKEMLINYLDFDTKMPVVKNLKNTR